MIQLNDRFAKSGQVVERTIGGERLLVPLGTSQARLDGMYSLNELAGAIWDQAVSGKTAQQIVESMTQAYDVQTDKAASDVLRTLSELVEAGALALDH